MPRVDDDGVSLTTDLDYLVARTTEYYTGLVARGIPEPLAVRIVGDWYGSAVMLANTYFSGHYEVAASALTRRMARSMGRE